MTDLAGQGSGPAPDHPSAGCSADNQYPSVTTNGQRPAARGASSTTEQEQPMTRSPAPRGSAKHGMAVAAGLTICTYAIGVLLAFAAGIPAALGGIAWTMLCVAFAIVTGWVVGTIVGRTWG